jgi:hypothetical protein
MSRLLSRSEDIDIGNLQEAELARHSRFSESKSVEARVIVHPLIWAFGKEEVKDYIEGRVL